MNVKHNTRGFSLIELLLALVLLAIAMKTLIMLILSFTSSFTALRQNHTTYAVLAHASDFVNAELLAAYPYSIETNETKTAIRYRKVLYHGSVYVQKTMQGWKFTIPARAASQRHNLTSLTAIAFKAQPGLIHAVNINSGNDFVFAHNQERKLSDAQWVEAYVLSYEYTMKFSPNTKALVRESIGSMSNNVSPALISHLANCKFNWYSDYKTLTINLVQGLDDKNDYTFVQQIFLKE